MKSLTTLVKKNRGLILFLLCVGLFRTGIADWNTIPSGSMRPNLLVGDVVLVNRLAYDIKVPLTNIIVAHLGDPKRGDIVTFDAPKEGTRLIKRVVALPGDRVEMKNDVLLINGKAAEYGDPEPGWSTLPDGNSAEALRMTETIGDSERRIQLLPGLPARRDFGPLVVPEGQFLMLGDNRDNSADSRYFGFVPRNLLIGRASRVLVSADVDDSWHLRWERFGMALH